jgi:hypothetical protein
LEGVSVPITKDNMAGLLRLCEEFPFGALAERLSQFRESDDLTEEGMLKDLEARKRFMALEERMQERDYEIAALRTELSRQSRVQESASEGLLGRVTRLEAEVSGSHTPPALPHSIVPEQQSPPSIVPPASVAPAVSASPLAIPPSGSVPQAVVPVASAPAPTSAASAVVPPRSGWNSTVVPDFPTLFGDFKKKQFTLLCRGSRNGFGCWDFHSRCDGHPNTLTVILDTKGNIFGGFTPVEWESGCRSKADPSLKTFLFTLKNPHNAPARRFGLKAAQAGAAIWCNTEWGPSFGYDIHVSNNCNANTNSYTYMFGVSYINDTGSDKNRFFTGSQSFQVREIEVFEVSD